MNNLDLIQSVYTRISHDLSGAAGAVYNGTELLCEDLSFAEQGAKLIQSSAANLMARLKFFRQTFGLQNKEQEDTTAEYLKTFSMPFTLNRPCENALQRTLVMAMTDLFYKGASFTIEKNYVKAEGSAIKDVPELKEVLEKGFFTGSANDAPALFAFYEALDKKKKLTFTRLENCVKVSIEDN